MARMAIGLGQGGGPLEVKPKPFAQPATGPQELIERAWLAARFLRHDGVGAGSVGDRLALANASNLLQLSAEDSPWTVPAEGYAWLVEGRVRVLDDRGMAWLDSDDRAAEQPLPPGATLKADEHRGATLALLAESILAAPPREHHDNPFSPACYLAEAVFADFEFGTLRLPTMPRVAFLIRERAEDPNVNLQEIAEIAQSDGAIAGRLLHVANSVAFAGGPRHRTVLAAVQRLGLKTTQSLVLSLALREVFAFDSPLVKHEALRAWRFSVAVSAAAYAVADASGLDGQIAIMAGLVHQIGQVPILAATEQHGIPIEPPTLKALLDRLVKPATFQVLGHWGLDSTALDAARHWDNWNRRHAGPGDYGDVIQLAARFYLEKNHMDDALPALEALPAVSALGLNTAPEELEELRVAMDMSMAMMVPLLHG